MSNAVFVVQVACYVFIIFCRPGVTFLELPSLPKGEFTISAKFTTAKTVPSQPVPFILTVQSSQVFSVEHS